LTSSGSGRLCRSAYSGNIWLATRSEHRGERCYGKETSQETDELFHDTLKDIYFAEKKILSTLPKMEKAAQAPALKRAFAKHKTETEGHVTRLEKVFAATLLTALLAGLVLPARRDRARQRWWHNRAPCKPQARQ
jgi:Domain of unknown function (DUF892)